MLLSWSCKVAEIKTKSDQLTKLYNFHFNFFFPFPGRILFAPGSASTTSLRFPSDKDDEENGSPPPKRDMEEKEENIEFLQITPTTIQVQFPGITGGNLVSWERSLQCCFRSFLRQQHCS